MQNETHIAAEILGVNEEGQIMLDVNQTVDRMQTEISGMKKFFDLLDEHGDRHLQAMAGLGTMMCRRLEGYATVISTMLPDDLKSEVKL